jgi:hypothetical protein
VVDEAVGDEDVAALARQRYPRGSLLHTSLPLLLPPWAAGTRNGQCQYCNRDPSAVGRVLAQDPLCNCIACADCVGLRGTERQAVAPSADADSAAGDLEWLCSGCTTMWLRAVTGSDDAGWTAVCDGGWAPQPSAQASQSAGGASRPTLCARWLPAAAAPGVRHGHGGSAAAPSAASGGSGLRGAPPTAGTVAPVVIGGPAPPRAVVLYEVGEEGQTALRLWPAADGT